MLPRLKAFVLVIGLGLLACCKSKDTPPSKGQANESASTQHASGSPQPGYEPCARFSNTVIGETTSFDIGKLHLEGKGRILRATNQIRRPSLVLGVIGQTQEALAPTLKNLDRFMARFAQARVQAIVVLGGLDPTFEGIKTILLRLGKRFPVLALPGDRESRAGFQAAVENAGNHVLDLTKARILVLPEATLVSVPGYFLPHHLLAKEQGCSYNKGDLNDLLEKLKGLPKPRVLLSHGPPRFEGRKGIDRAFGDVNIGDPFLKKFVVHAHIDFGLFAHVHESAGKAMTTQGAVVPPMSWSPSLMLNVGTADSIPHQTLNGIWSRGSAAIFELKDGKARFRMLGMKSQKPPSFSQRAFDHPPPVR